MEKKIVLLDGAVGTGLWEKAEDKKPVWMYNVERPEIVRELSREYIAAGAQIIFSNTFGANRQAVERSSDYTVREVVSAGVRIAKEEARGKDVKVALSVGPLLELMEPYGDLTEEETFELFDEQISAGMEVETENRPDLIVLETFMDVEMMRVAVGAAKKHGVPVFCMMTFESVGKTMMGQSVETVLETLEPLGIDAVGMNCSLGPAQAVPIIKEFAEKTSLPIIFKPNAGKPVASENGTEYPYTAKDFAEEVLPALQYVSYIGGCCGSTPDYVREIKATVEKNF